MLKKLKPAKTTEYFASHACNIRLVAFCGSNGHPFIKEHIQFGTLQPALGKPNCPKVIYEKEKEAAAG
jgi:hypothetical protein